jgi:hypothetical protein
LPEVYEIVADAVNIAFPNGVPEDVDDYEECTEWSKSQEELLGKLFERFEQYNGAITNIPGKHIPENMMS